MVKSKLNIKINLMQIIYQILKKGNRTIFLLTLLMILTVVIMNYHNYKKSINETNIKNLINNVYFKKTLTNIFSQFDPKYEKINHNVLKGQSLSNILDKYSVNKNELELVKKSLVKKYKVNNLKINDLLEFTIDRSNQKIIEFSYPVSKTKKIYLTRTKDFKSFNTKENSISINKNINDFIRKKQKFLANDKKGKLVYLSDSEFTLKMAQQNYSDLKFHFTSEF